METEEPLEVVNPLSLSINSAGEKILILDVKYINKHLFKQKVKFDDCNCFENHLEANKGYFLNLISKNQISSCRHFYKTSKILGSHEN